MDNQMDQQQAREDLRFIRQMLEETRQRVADNGMHYISWTVMVALGIIGTYLIVLSDMPSSYTLWLWVVIIGAGWLISFLIGARQNEVRPQNFAEKVLSSVWTGAGISMTVVAFTGVAGDAFHPNFIPALIATILGIPYFTASVIYSLSWFRLIAAGWWLAGIGFFLWNSFHTLAVLGVLMILFQALPGLYLYKNFGTSDNKSYE